MKTTIDSKVQSTKQGTLSDIFETVEPDTIQHAWEIQRDRYKDIKANKDNAELPKQWFWTADFPLYKVEKGEAVLYFADRKNNLIFQNLDDAVAQLKTRNNYFPKDTDIGAVVSDKSTLRVNLSDLKLQGDKNDDYLYFEIKTGSYSELNKSQRALAEKIHGKGKAFDKTMKMLKDSGITTTRVYTLNPEYVKKTIEQNNANSLARGSFLNSFGGDSDFDAFIRDVDNDDRRLRGVPLGAEGARAQKIDQYDLALQLLTGNPKETLTRMQSKPEYAAKLLKIVTDYLSKA